MSSDIRFGVPGSQRINPIDWETYAELNGVGGQKTFPIDRTGNLLDGQQAVKIQTSGNATYIGLANPGTNATLPNWQAFKYDSGFLTWCDGNSLFDNVATDLTSLTYS